MTTMGDKNHPVFKTNVLLSKTTIDNLAIASLDVNYVDKSDFVEYTLSSGQKIMLPPAFIAIGNNTKTFLQLVGQTYPVHVQPGKPSLMTDYIFLATEDGKKGAPWTRDPKTFEFFIRAAQRISILHQEYIKDGKRYIDTPFIQKFLFDGKLMK